jgi:hypothetical protein
MSHVLVALRHCSYALMYCFQNFRSSMSETLNFQFFSGSSMRSRKRLAALRVNPGHHVRDRAVFSRGIHRLKDQQDSVAV